MELGLQSLANNSRSPIPAMLNRSDITLIPFEGSVPKIHPSVFIAPGVRIVGDVEVGEDSSIWFNVVIRGDVHFIRIGERTNIQDLTMCHVTNQRFPLVIGNDVTVGHSAVLHGTTIGNRVLIGMGAKVLDNSIVESDSLIAAGAVVREGFRVPEGTLAAGVPAKIIRELSDQERAYVAKGANNYIGYVARFRADGNDW